MGQLLQGTSVPLLHQAYLPFMEGIRTELKHAIPLPPPQTDDMAEYKDGFAVRFFRA